MRIEEAYERWARELTGYASALVGPADAADVVADAFARLLAGEAGRWEAVVEHRPYLFRCVLNAARMRRRSTGRREVRERRVAVVGGSSGEAARNVPEQGMVDPSMLEALNSLSVQQRAVAYFTYWEDLSVDQIAAVLDVSSGTVKQQLARARAKMRKVLS